ncbi:unnamed protein product [Absidia cylindrospora]
MNRSRFFTTIKRGETYELKAELNSDQRHIRSEAVKKVIANMTVSKDVSGLFPDVLKNMQTDDLELKKLVYLYLMNYAKTQPELVILAVNTFVKDTDDPNPLIRALAIRTMGCIRVEKMVDYLTDPLRRCLKDESPYVRKTAALCVAKLYEIHPELTVEQDLLGMVKEMVSDVNPMVVANAVIALLDINEVSMDGIVFEVTQGSLNKLLHALNECTEWGQVSILAAITDYIPKNPKEAEGICDRVFPRLQHVNGAVVLSAIKVILVNMNYIEDQEVLRSFRRKMAPSLATLLSNPPEVQYIALRNIRLILQKHSDVLDREIRVFFCKYNDPLYVKLEKLKVLNRLCNSRNVDQLLTELKEYANEVDVDFVRKSINAIGRCAIKLEEASERCIHILLELIETGASYVVQEAIVVIKDIFRRYPNRYEGILPTLCENLDVLDEPDAKAAMIWMVGEYADRIDNAADLMEFLFEPFNDETVKVQLQLVTSIVKLFLKKPDDTQVLVQKALQASTECDNADIRDRGYIYWRLLSTDPQAAKAIVLSEKPEIDEKLQDVPSSLLDELISQIGTLASVYYKPSETFVHGQKYGADNVNKATSSRHLTTRNEVDEDDMTAPPPKIQAALKNNDIGNLLDLDWDEPPTTSSPQSASAGNPGSNQTMDDLLSLGPMATTPLSSTSNNIQQHPPIKSMLDIFDSPTTPVHANHQQEAIGGDLFGKPSSSQQESSKQDTKDPFAGLF